jgi:hypothetical protein
MKKVLTSLEKAAKLVKDGALVTFRRGNLQQSSHGVREEGGRI